MKTRIKVSLPLLTTREDAESVMTDLAGVINLQRKLTAARDARVLAINKDYEDDLANVDQSIKQKTDALRAWAESNHDQFPKGRKSVVMVSGTLGFRTGTPKLALLSRAWNWDKVLTAMKVISEMAAAFIRTKEEVNKEELIGFYSNPEFKDHAEADLRRIGLKLTQDESFYIEPNLTALETRQTVEAA